MRRAGTTGRSAIELASDNGVPGLARTLHDALEIGLQEKSLPNQIAAGAPDAFDVVPPTAVALLDRAARVACLLALGTSARERLERADQPGKVAKTAQRKRGDVPAGVSPERK